MKTSFLNRLSSSPLDLNREAAIRRNLQSLFNTIAPFDSDLQPTPHRPAYTTAALNYGLPASVLATNDTASELDFERIKQKILRAIRLFEPRLKNPSLEWTHTEAESLLAFDIRGVVHDEIDGGQDYLMFHTWCDANHRFYLK